MVQFGFNEEDNMNNFSLPNDEIHMSHEESKTNHLDEETKSVTSKASVSKYSSSRPP